MSASEAYFNADESIDVKPKLIKLKRLKPKAKFTCVLCKEQFTDPPALKEHFRKHGYAEIKKEAPISGGIPCEYCALVLPNMSAAIGHKNKKHLYEGSNYSCENCGGLFPIHVALEKHQETCLKPKGVPEPSSNSDVQIKEEFELVFTCMFCHAVFLSSEAVSFHQNHVHRIERDLMENVFLPPPSTKIRVNHNNEVYSVYYCYLCGIPYCLKHNLKKHLLTAHTAEQRIKLPEDGIIRCKLCEGLFYTKSAYNAHFMHHTDDDLYVVSEEQRRQVVNRVDQDFDVTRVPRKTDPFEPVRRNLRKKPELPFKATQIDDEPMSPPSSALESSDEEGSKKEDLNKRPASSASKAKDLGSNNAVKSKQGQKKLPLSFASQPNDEDESKTAVKNKRGLRKRSLTSASKLCCEEGSKKAMKSKRGQKKLSPAPALKSKDKCSKNDVKNKRGQKKLEI